MPNSYSVTNEQAHGQEMFKSTYTRYVNHYIYVAIIITTR